MKTRNSNNSKSMNNDDNLNDLESPKFKTKEVAYKNNIKN